MGGKLVDQDAQGNWFCAFDSEAAVETYYYVARLFHEPFENAHGKFTSVVYTGLAEAEASGTVRYGMFFGYIDPKLFSSRDPEQYGFGPVPNGPDGKRGSEFNASMTGIYAGIEDKALRDAAWKYIHFFELDGMDELYDLENDPYEMKNLVSSLAHQKVLTEMKQKMRKLLQESETPEYLINV